MLCSARMMSVDSLLCSLYFKRKGMACAVSHLTERSSFEHVKEKGVVLRPHAGPVTSTKCRLENYVESTRPEESCRPSGKGEKKSYLCRRGPQLSTTGRTARPQVYLNSTQSIIFRNHLAPAQTSSLKRFYPKSRTENQIASFFWTLILEPK